MKTAVAVVVIVGWLLVALCSCALPVLGAIWLWRHL